MRLIPIVSGFCFLLSCFVQIDAYAQDEADNKDTKTLLKSYNEDGLVLSTFYSEIAPTTAFSKVNGNLGSFVLLEVGLHLNRSIAIGYYGARAPKTIIVNVPQSGSPEYQEWINSGVELDQLATGQTQAYIYFKHTGLNIGYMYKAENILFPRCDIKLGRGVLEMTTEQKQFFQFFTTTIYKKKVWNLNPEVGLGINLRPWWRLHLDVGYHFVLDGTSEIIDSGNFDGVTYKLGFGFGAFNK